jgi:hypothetical protein
VADGDKHTVLANSPLRHWGLERGETGEITIGDGSDGTVTQADFDGRLEIGHAAIVKPPAKKAAGGGGSKDEGDTPPAP